MQKKNKINLVVVNKPKALVPRVLINKVIKRCLEINKIQNALVSVIIVNGNNIKKMNSTFRNKDKETTVLSFPLFSDKDFIVPGTYNNLGDIILNIEKIKQDSSEYENDLIFNIMHSFLHLLGYTHSDSKKALAMERKERKLLKEIYEVI